MKVPVSSLIHHPLNEKIYTLSDIDELSESIKQLGLLQPLSINSKNEIISGNRRFSAIVKLGWKNVEVERISISKKDEPLYLVHYNSQRKKNVKELLNEYDILKDYYKKNKLNEKGNTLRRKISSDIKLTDGQLARLLFIRKHRPDFIDLIDSDVMSIGQAYLQCSRQNKESISINSNGNDFKSNFKFDKSNFQFYKKSSKDMTEIPDGSISTIFCSPPYPKSIRKYTQKDILGNEKTIDEYLENMSNHFNDCYRVISEKGSMYINIGDVYVDGCLQLVPQKLIIKILEKKNWILKSEIIWKRSNAKPYSSKINRPSPVYEYIFHLVKSKKYNYESLLMPISNNTKSSFAPRHRNKNSNYGVQSIYVPNPDGKNLPNYWDEETIVTAVANQKHNNGIEHPAMYPISLPVIPIINTCVMPFLKNTKPENICSVVLDIFSGSQSTYKAVQNINKMFQTNLKYIGYDIKKYF